MNDRVRIRRSKQREIILEELVKLGSHPSAGELYDRVRKRLPRVSLGTVYRNLEIFAREGLVKRLELDGERVRYDGERGDHCHIKCLRCGRIEDLPASAPPDGRDRAIVRRSGYRLVERCVQYLGVCPACRKKERVS